MAIELVGFRSALAPNNSSWTFTDVELGAAADDRYIIVVAGGRRATGGTIQLSNVTVAAAATDNVESPSSTNVTTGIRRTSSPLTSGTSGDIVVTFSTVMANCWVAVYRATGLVSPSAEDKASVATANLTPGVSIDAAAGAVVAGVTVAIAADNTRYGGAASRAFASPSSSHSVSVVGSSSGIVWTGLDEDGEANISEGVDSTNISVLVAASFEIFTPSDGLAAGSSTAAAEGRSEHRAAGEAAGAAMAAATGRAGTRASGSAAGAASAAAAGRSEVRASGSAAGSASATAAAIVPGGSAAGSSTAAATGRAEARGGGEAAGSSAAAAIMAASGVAEGLSLAAATGRAEARAAGLAEGWATVQAAPPPAGRAAGTATAQASGRAEHRAGGEAAGTALADAAGQAMRRFFVNADANGYFRLDIEGLLPPGAYTARARRVDGGSPSGWSREAGIEVT